MMPTTTTRAAIYTRVSSEEQIDGTSLDSQRDRCTAWCEAKGWALTEVYTDEGISGSKSSRPALDRLMASIDAGHIDAVVVYKTDRFSRSRAHLFTTLEALAAKGVAFTSVTEAFDTSTTSGDAMVGMLGVFAQMERNLIRERTRSGVNAKVRAGGWGGGNIAPYGYRIDGKGRDARLVVDDAEAHLVRTAVSMVLDLGLSTLEASKRLNALGLTPRNVPLWTSSNLRNMLARGQWGGQWTFGKTATQTLPEPITVAVEPVLDAERFAALQAHLGKTALVRTTAHSHPLSGRLFCECGQPMTGIARSDRANRRYRCRNGFYHPARTKCSNGSIKAQPVDDAAWSQVLDLLTDPDRLMARAREALGMLETSEGVTAEHLEDAEKAVARAQKAVARGAARCISLGLDQATTEDTLAELREQHRAAVDHRATLAAMRSETAEAKARLVTAQQLADVARDRLATADSHLRARVFALLDVRATITDRTDGVSVNLTGSVAHELLLAGISQPVAPAIPATACG